MGILTSRNLYKNWILNKINQDPSDFCKVYKAKDDCEEIIEKSLIEAYDNLENKSFEIINVDLPMYKVLKSLFQRRNEIMSDPYKDYGSANRLIYDLGHPESSL